MRLKLKIALCLLCVGVVFAAEEGGMPPEMVPQVMQVIPENTATLSQAKYPNFTNCSGERDCCSILYNLSGRQKGYGGRWEEIAGLSTTVNVPAAYRKTAKILVTWTVRVEGDAIPETIWSRGGGGLCRSFHGSVTQQFPGGVVRTKAQINGKDKGGEASLTIPESQSYTTVITRDPTITGSVLVKPDDYEGDSFTVKIFWQNETSLRIRSPAKQRSLIITIIPQVARE